MSDFKKPYQAKGAAPFAPQGAGREAAATSAPGYKMPAYRGAPAAQQQTPAAGQRPAGQQPQGAPVQPAFRPMQRETQINIPDFLKNKR